MSSGHCDLQISRKKDFEQAQRLGRRVREVREASADSLFRIGEIRDLLTDFTSAILVLRPNDIFQFAYDYFSAFFEPP
ncbi:hypothetical protein Efla_004041 [Eimeria flavescens]